jgi:hypothetical protein
MERMIESNSRMRLREDWERLFGKVSPGLVNRSATMPYGSGLTVMEFGSEKCHSITSVM